MADSESNAERSEAATPRKQEEAFNDGKIPKSQELTIAVSLLASAGVITTVGPVMGHAMVSFLSRSLSGVGTLTVERGSVPSILRETGWSALVIIMPMVLALSATTMAIAAVQARGVFSIKPLMPDFSRISPLQNGKRLFGTEQIAILVKSLAKFGIVAAVVYPVLSLAMPSAISLAELSQLGFLMMVKLYSVKLLATAGTAYLALAAADYLWQWWRHQQSLRMTREEVKQEMKQQDGDQMMRHRRRNIARARARRQMMRDVKNAHVIITNPTHIAVALRYDPKVAPAPIVLAIGQNLIAQRIKELAREAGIPMVENRPLARALLKTARVGTLIPVDLYVAVAEVLAFVFRTRGTRGSWTGSTVA